MYRVGIPSLRISRLFMGKVGSTFGMRKTDLLYMGFLERHALITSKPMSCEEGRVCGVRDEVK